MIPLVPNKFRDASTLDPERINQDLLGIARDVNRNLRLRYMTTPIVFPLDGMVDTDAAELRRRRVRAATYNSGEIVRVELRIYAADGATWSVTSSDAAWPGLAVDTAGANVQAAAQIDAPIAVGAADTYFTLSASGGSTILRGDLILHFRCDRGVQGNGTTHAEYEPVLYDAATSRAGATLDAQLVAAEDAVLRDLGDITDLRAQVYSRAALATDAAIHTRVWRLPAAARKFVMLHARIVATAGAQATWTLKDASGVTWLSMVIVGTGDANVVTGVATSALATQDDDPTNDAADWTLEVEAAVGSVALSYATLWAS